jgi:hypothetical protein
MSGLIFSMEGSARRDARTYPQRLQKEHAVIDLESLEPPTDADGRPLVPPSEVVFPQIHEFFLERRWSPKPLMRLANAKEARKRWGDEPWRQFLQGSAADPGAVITAKHNYEREQLACSFHRKVVDFFHLHLSCDRKACRRAHACATTDIDCYYVVQPYLKKVYYPGLRPLMREELARREALGAGPDPNEAVAPPSPARRRRR